MGRCRYDSSCVLPKCLVYYMGMWQREYIRLRRPSCVPNISVRLCPTSTRMRFPFGLGGSRPTRPKAPKAPKAPSSKHFDGKAFSDYVHDIGRAYRHRAIELIRICQRFSGASEQSFDQDKALTRYLLPANRTSMLTSL